MPLPGGCRDSEYERVFIELIVPAVWRYSLELILVSAGYDGHWVDDIGHMRLMLEGYIRISWVIDDLACELCGYNLIVLSAAINNTFMIWLGENLFDDPLELLPHDIKSREGIDDLISAVKNQHGL